MIPSYFSLVIGAIIFLFLITITEKILSIRGISLFKPRRLIETIRGESLARNLSKIRQIDRTILIIDPYIEDLKKNCSQEGVANSRKFTYAFQESQIVLSFLGFQDFVAPESVKTVKKTDEVSVEFSGLDFEGCTVAHKESVISNLKQFYYYREQLNSIKFQLNKELLESWIDQLPPHWTNL